ncbi:MAG: magnesium transporter CorA family protein [Steroidobacteraceae bacterium]
MITFWRQDGSGLHRTSSENDLAAPSSPTPGDPTWAWIALDSEPAEHEAAIMRRQLNAHPEAVRDAQRQRHPPKFEDFGDYSFILLKELQPGEFNGDFTTSQLAIFVSATKILTRHNGRSMACEQLARELKDTEHPTPVDAWRLALRLCRIVADGFLERLMKLESRLDAIEDQIEHEPRDALLSELSSQKLELRRLRRTCVYHAQLFSGLRQLPPTALVMPDSAPALNDVSEQMERTASLATLYHDLVGDLTESYLSMAAHRLNGIMKVLTIVTTIFVPLGFLAGIYGMNFTHMPELASRYGYYLLLGFMAVVATTLLWLFRRRKWL